MEGINSTGEWTKLTSSKNGGMFSTYKRPDDLYLKLDNVLDKMTLQELLALKHKNPELAGILLKIAHRDREPRVTMTNSYSNPDEIG